jgi:hypothetical protein
MSLYKYVTIDALRHILRGSVRFTQPSAFNDPFEMLPEMHVPPSTDSGNVTIKFSLTAPRRHPPVAEFDPGAAPDACDDSVSRDVIERFNQSLGILCMSRTRDSLLMWAHYADRYSGAMVEFDEAHEFFTGRIDVDYRSSRPKRDIGAYISAGEPVPVAELCVKSDQWAYEKEVRIVRSFSDCKRVSERDGFAVYVMDLPMACIKSVTLGERTPVDAQREVLAILETTSIPLNLAVVAHREYEFRIEPVKLAVPLSEMPPIISPRTAHIFSGLGGDIGETARWAIANHPLSKLVNKRV